MALTDLLSSLISGNGGLGFGQTVGAVDPGQATGPGAQATMPLDELLVQGRASGQRPGAPITMAAPPSDPNMAPSPADVTLQGPVAQTSNGPSINYNNSDDVAAVHQSLMNNQPVPGGMTSPGLYGLLPQNLQHGTLRGVLGALGDSLLVSGGKAPEYANSQARQQMGNAMAGMNIDDPNSVAAAVQRIGATGAPGAPELADKVQQQAEQAALRKQYMDYNNTYRQGVLGEREQYHQSQTDARNQTVLRQNGMALSGLVANAKTPQQYKAVYDKAEAIAQKLGPQYHAADMGMVEPESWSPGVMSGFGMTGNNVQQAGDRAAGRAQSQTNAEIGAGSRVASARISAGSRPPSEAGFEEYLQNRMTQASNGGPPLTSGETAAVYKHFGPSRTQRSPVTSSTNPAGASAGAAFGASAGAAAGGRRQQFVNGRVYTDANGNHATYQNGKWIPH